LDSSRVGLIDVEDGHSIVRHVVHGGDDNVMKQNKDVRRREKKTDWATSPSQGRGFGSRPSSG
jgi:hypothetical protein